MEKSLPFEYGYLYKVIDNPTQEDKDVIQNTYYQEDIFRPWYSVENQAYSSYGSPLSVSVYGERIDENGKFLPIAFKENSQKVVLEMVIEEEEIHSGIMQLENNQFKTATIKKHNKRVRRIELDVNVFIRNFEKVL